ncbi:hypothetical protein EHQ23_16880 [Leptospira bourretii]|uniref:Uncharacterized protein n=1 Tax=Leptospira bourretii TaxID=2484962 RepID=A0A4R9IN08_9LEPT|nr:hypothetical protein [Leptospira bourretii]TGK79284.1 hypothetical protein EHQ23_16880 [Leptospira bourretii]TGK92466.1 hypothetical protein EHQ26_08670 [Leptospira bourretii]TGL29245.1 hypothetical protein EHQ45_15040 [Leptospira bourretii]
MEIKNIRNKIQELKSKNISHPELGELNDFRKAEVDQNKIFTFFENSLIELETQEDKIPSIIKNQFYTTLISFLDQISSFHTQIDNLVVNGIHRPEFPGQRSNILNWFAGDHIYSNPQIINLIIYSNSIKVSNNTFALDYSKKTNELNKELEKIAKLQKETENILNKIQDKVSSKVVNEAITNFDGLESHHSKYANAWFITFIISMSFSALAFGISIFFFPISDEPKLGEIIRNILYKSFFIVFPSIISKISLTKYQTERHLKILYSHRSAVLSQFKEFEISIGDSIDAKNQFRLEIAKYLFSDPQTGLLKNSNAGDLNVNPIVSIIEKIGLPKAN